MKITFSFNQVSQIQLNAVRCEKVYGAVRSHLGIPVGTLFSNFDLLDVLLGDSFTKFTDEDSTEYVHIRREDYDLQVVLHAIRTHIAVVNIQLALNAFAAKEVSLSAVSKTVRHAKSMIDATEW